MKLYLLLALGLVTVSLIAIKQGDYLIGLFAAVALVYVAIAGPRDFDDPPTGSCPDCGAGWPNELERCPGCRLSRREQAAWEQLLRDVGRARG